MLGMFRMRRMLGMFRVGRMFRVLRMLGELPIRRHRLLRLSVVLGLPGRAAEGMLLEFHGPMLGLQASMEGTAALDSSLNPIANRARPGEVLVTQEVVDASAGADVTFNQIGPVELKGISGVVALYAAHRG